MHFELSRTASGKARAVRDTSRFGDVYYALTAYIDSNGVHRQLKARFPAKIATLLRLVLGQGTCLTDVDPESYSGQSILKSYEASKVSQ